MIIIIITIIIIIIITVLCISVVSSFVLSLEMATSLLIQQGNKCNYTKLLLSVIVIFITVTGLVITGRRST
jgi:hypothetical protein